MRLISGPPVLSGGSYRVSPRCAWLLQVNRLAHRPELSRREFAQELRERGYPIDEWKLTRWESGDHKVSLDAAAALDQAVESDGPVIASAVAYLQTSPLRAGRNGLEKPLKRLSDAEFDLAFERLLAGEGSGLDWYDVLADDRVRAGAYLPPSVWKSLTGRLFDELARAVGPARALRKRAVSLLMRQGNGHVRAALAEFIQEAACQGLAAATNNLVYGRGRSYNDLAVESLRHPDYAGSWGAMHAVAAKLSLGHFRSWEIPRIESRMLAVLHQRPPHDGAEALFRALPIDSQLRVASGVKNGDLILRSLPTLQPLAGHWSSLVKSVAHRAREDSRVAAPQEDMMLQSLITEALLHPHYEGRTAARITLAASPYRSAAAQAAIDLLPGATTDEQGRLGEFLAFTADRSHVDALSVLLEKDLTPAVEEFAFTALGRIPGPLPPEVLEVARAALTGPTTKATRGAIYALAMHGELQDVWHLVSRLDHPLVGNCWKSQGEAILV